MMTPINFSSPHDDHGISEAPAAKNCGLLVGDIYIMLWSSYKATMRCVFLIVAELHDSLPFVFLLRMT